MKRERTSLITMGIPSLFLIFAVLCLVILSLLTLGASRSDLSASLRSMEQTEAYYNACAQATELCEKAGSLLSEARRESKDREDYFRLAARCEEEGLQWTEETGRLRFSLPISGTQELTAELQVLYPEKEGDPCMKIVLWNTSAAGEWNPDTRQPVYKEGADK